MSPRREALHDWLASAPYEEVHDRWASYIDQAGLEARDTALADLCLADRFFLLTRILHRPDADRPWIYQRCREVEAKTDGCLDLWAREHYKSTIITFAGSIQEILLDPEITIGIFSHTRPDASKFLIQIKGELETNKTLMRLFPDILYDDPAAQSPMWSVSTGITVKRTSNAREMTVEAHGVVDSQPVGSHFRLMIFDDLVTMISVSTPDQVKKTTERYDLADSLGARGADGLKRKWHIGTRYSFADTYQQLINRKVLHVRLHAATDNGLMTGAPVFLSKKAWAMECTKPSNIVAAQMLQNPAAGNEAMFKEEWLKGHFLHIRPSTLTVAIMCDPASSKKKGSDDTVMHVWGMDAARNRYLLDGFHHKMSLSERWTNFRDLHKMWSQMPGVQLVKMGYERFGSTADLEYFTERMEMEKYHFDIAELAWPRESEEKSKYDRIQRLEPDFRLGKMFFAKRLPDGPDGNQVAETKEQAEVRAAGQDWRVWLPVRRMDHERKVYGLQTKFFAEYILYPFSPHDDGLDTASRWSDMDMHPPVIIDERQLEPETFEDGA